MRYLLELGDSMKSGGLSDDGEEDLDMDMMDEDLKADDDEEDEDDPVPALGQLVKPKVEPGQPASRPMTTVTTAVPTSAVGMMAGAAAAAGGTVQPVAVTNGSSTGIVWIASGSLFGLQQQQQQQQGQPPPPPPPLYSIKQLNNSQVVI